MVHLPAGPIWVLHGFYVVTSALMLLWWLRYRPALAPRRSEYLVHEHGATHDTTIAFIGAGQAGLSTGYHLRRLGQPFVILDGNARVGDPWRAQWDSLRLFTPAKYDGLTGTVPRRPVELPRQGRVRRLPRVVRRRLRPAGPVHCPGGHARR